MSCWIRVHKNPATCPVSLLKEENFDTEAHWDPHFQVESYKTQLIIHFPAFAAENDNSPQGTGSIVLNQDNMKQSPKII